MGILTGLLADYLDRQRQDTLRQQQDADFRKARALQLLNGANPSEDEVAAFANNGGVDFAMPAGINADEEQRLYQRKQALRDAAANPQNQQLAQLMDMHRQLSRAGLASGDFYDDALKAGRLLAISNFQQQGKLTPEQTVDAYGNKSVAPVDVNGGVAFNRYSPSHPIVGESDANRALAALRSAQAGTEGAQQDELAAKARLLEDRRSTEAARQVELNAHAGLFAHQADDIATRSAAVKSLLGNPDVDTLLKIDAANNKAMPKADTVKVRKADGSTVYMQRIPRPQGGFDFRETAGPDAAPLAVPPTDSANRLTARQSNIKDLMETYDLTPEEATGIELADPHTRTMQIKKFTERKAQKMAATGVEQAKARILAQYKAGQITRDQALAEAAKLGIK